jgi:hypothetical protein
MMELLEKALKSIIFAAPFAIAIAGLILGIGRFQSLLRLLRKK